MAAESNGNNTLAAIIGAAGVAIAAALRMFGKWRKDAVDNDASVIRAQSDERMALVNAGVALLKDQVAELKTYIADMVIRHKEEVQGLKDEIRDLRSENAKLRQLVSDLEARVP